MVRDPGWGALYSHMVVYHFLHVLKFSGVVLFAGGIVASFVSRAPAERRLAAHGLASPGLLITWTAGYLLSLRLGIGLRELWTLAGLVLSFAAHLALLRSLNRERSALAIALVAGPLFAVLLLMVFRPTWSVLRP